MYGISSVGTMPYGTDSSLALLGGDLNGLVTQNYGNFGTYGTYPMFGGNVTDVEGAKTSIKNQYDVYATQQSYGNKQNIENMSLAQRSNTIAELLRADRSDDAADQFDVLVAELKSSPQYSEYSDAQLKAVACSVYQRSTGENLVEAIKTNTPGSFAKGLIVGIPVIGTFFADSSSKEDLTAKVTGMPLRAQDQVAKSAGALISGGTTGAVIGGVIGGFCGGGAFSWATAPIGAAIGGAIGGAIGLVKSFFK